MMMRPCICIVFLSIALFPGLMPAQSLLPSLSTAQDTTTGIGTAPPGCSTTSPYIFDIKRQNKTIRNVGRSLDALIANLRRRSKSSTVIRRTPFMYNLTLSGGNITDPYGRNLFVATNGLLNVHSLPWVGQRFTGPFSICNDSTLALGSVSNWSVCNDGKVYFEPSDESGCYPIYAMADRKRYLSDTTAPVTTPSPTASSIASSSASSQPSSTVAPAGKHVSHTEALVGGILGGLVGIGSLTALIAIVLLRWRKRHHRIPNWSTKAEMDAQWSQFGELHGNRQRAAELHNRYVSELSASKTPEPYDHVEEEHETTQSRTSNTSGL